MTDDSAFKKQVRARMAQTGEKYTVARRMVITGRDPGQPPVALRVYLASHVDLELTDEAARAYQAAAEPGRRDMANRAGTWTRSGLIFTPPGRAWCSAMVVRGPTGSAPSSRS